MKSTTRSHGVPAKNRTHATSPSRNVRAANARRRSSEHRRAASPAAAKTAERNTARTPARKPVRANERRDAGSRAHTKGATSPRRGEVADHGEDERDTFTATPPRRPESRFRSGSPRRRMIVALIVIGAVLLGLIGRVAYLQTNEAENLRSAATDQWTRSVTLPAQRGTMFDRHGAELAMSVPAVTVSINPKLIDNGPATVQILNDLLDLPDGKATELLAEIESKDRGFVFVQRQADADIGDQIAAMRLAGVNVDRESRREMPGGDTGRSVIGRTNIDGVGISGLEVQYDDLLTGTGGEMRREVAPGGRSIPGSETVTEQPVAGDDIVLTLDRSVQYSTEQVLLEQVAAIGAKGATAIAMDTDTGEIFSMASVRPRR